MNFLFLNLIFPVYCSGIFVLFFILVTNIDKPNKPVNKGSKGWFKPSKFNTQNPKIPENVNAIIVLAERIKIMEGIDVFCYVMGRFFLCILATMCMIKYLSE